MTAYQHEVRITFGRGGDPATLSNVIEFEVVNDMLELADTFSLKLPFRRELWDAARPDTEIELFIDDSRVLTGFIDDRAEALSKGQHEISVSGRDRGGRLVDESAPLVRYEHIGLEELADALVSDWFPEVHFSNADNRRLIRGRGRQLARVSKEPPIVATKSKKFRHDKKVEPGESRSSVLSSFLDRAELLAWSSANGKQFIIGLPNYDQEPQWQFFVRGQDTNVMGCSYTESVGERYSEIVACGAGKGSATNYGPNVTRRRAVVTNGPGERGVGKDFAFPKRLILGDNDIKSAEQAQTRARREMAIRDSHGIELELEVGGWGQALSGRGRPALYAFDTMAHFENEESGVAGDFLITQVRFRESRSGQTSTLRLVPRGTELRV